MKFNKPFWVSLRWKQLTLTGKLISESIYPLGRDFYSLTMLQGEEFDMDALLEIGEILEKSY